MTLLKIESIPKFAQALKANGRLAKIAGFFDKPIPAAGTFYLFIDRLEDGAHQPKCPHRVLPSAWRKGKHRRNLKSEKQQREEDKKKDLTVYDSVTQALRAKLQAEADKPRPKDLAQRLSDILLRCAVIPSAQQGLLGDCSKLTIAGDGAALVSSANPHGRPTCDCLKRGISGCNHDRLYSDPAADWGYDSYRACYYFGHTFYQHVVSTQGHDLPIHVGIGPASETDFTLSLKSLSHLRKGLRENGQSWQIQHAVYDAGHDATGIYGYLADTQIRPIIALNPRGGMFPPPTGSAQRVNPNGVPLCPAGLEMRRHTYLVKQNRMVYNCPVKRPTHLKGKLKWTTHRRECPQGVLCQENTKMGPTVSVKTTADPRLYPPLSRESATFKRLMKHRSGCERSNSQKKETYRLARRVCRNAVHYLVRLHLVSLIEHARVWTQRAKQAVKDNLPKLIKSLAKMALANAA